MDATIARRLLEYFTRHPVRVYPKGQIILFANEPPTNVFFIAKGSVRQYEVSYRGDETVTHILKRYACFPSSWALNQVPNQYFFKAETETVVHIVPPANYLRFLKDNPDIVMYMFGQLQKNLDESDGRMVHLMIGTAKSRLIYELVVECRQHSSDSDGVRILRIKEVDLAARSGLSRETVSRELKRLRDSGWIDTNNGVVIVKSMADLEQALEPIVPY